MKKFLNCYKAELYLIHFDKTLKCGTSLKIHTPFDNLTRKLANFLNFSDSNYYQINSYQTWFMLKWFLASFRYSFDFRKIIKCIQKAKLLRFILNKIKEASEHIYNIGLISATTVRKLKCRHGRKLNRPPHPSVLNRSHFSALPVNLICLHEASSD